MISTLLRALATGLVPFGLFLLGLPGASHHALAADFNAGYMNRSFKTGDETTGASIWYPTASPARATAFGPFNLTVAIGAPMAPGRKPLVVVSHGTGGSELGHADIAQALASAGFVVVALTHPHDNFRDRSLSASRFYFEERPRQVQRLLDALLADPQFANEVDAARIGAFGHSAGGYTVLALAGAIPELARVNAHCAPDGAGPRDDAVFCGLGGKGVAPTLPSEPAAAQVRDARIRAVMAATPVGAVFAPASLAAVAIPVVVEAYGRDEVLKPAYHADHVCRHLTRATCVRTAEAGHFAALAITGTPLANSAGLSPGADPPGFDRKAYLEAVAERAVRFFRASL